MSQNPEVFRVHLATYMLKKLLIGLSIVVESKINLLQVLLLNISMIQVGYLYFTAFTDSLSYFAD